MQQVAVYSQLLAVGALGKLAALLVYLARGAVDKVCQQLVKAVALYAHALPCVAFLVEFIDRQRIALGGFHLGVAAVLGDGEERKVHGSAVLAVDYAGVFGAGFGHGFKAAEHAYKLIVKHTLYAVGRALEHAEFKLTRDYGGYALYHLHERL